MTDVLSPTQRHRCMSAVRSKDTSIERTVRSALHRQGFRFRLHVAELPGRPDVVLPRYRRIIFVHGCFWHGHGCKKNTSPKTNRTFWSKKITANRKRDHENQIALRQSGWKVVVIWECDLERGLTELMNDLKRARKHSERVTH